MSGWVVSRMCCVLVAAVVLLACVAIQTQADEAPAATANAAVQSTVNLDEDLLALGYLHIAVARVDSIKIEQWSDSLAPLPVGYLNIIQQVRGVMSERIRFVPLLYGTTAYESQQPESMKHWKGHNLDSFVGKQWILISNGVDVLAVYPFSDKTLAYIKTHMVAEGPGDIVLLLLALLIVGLSGLSRKSGQLFGAWAPGILLIVQLGIYAFYELNTPAYNNIRIDLLFIIPAIVLNIVLTSMYYGKRKTIRPTG